MSTIIKFDLKHLRKLSNDKNSCVKEKRVKQKMSLQPWCLGNIKESIKSLLDYKIGKYHKEYKGILLSYKNLRILQNVGTIRNDNPDIHFEVQADYFIFEPYIGATLSGIVNKKSNIHLVVLVHRVFNVVIPRPTEEPGSKWIGSDVQLGQEVVFKLVVMDLFGALPYMRGELDERCLVGPDGDEEFESRHVEILNQSYVHLDKTKANQSRKEMEEKTQNIDSKTDRKQLNYKKTKLRITQEPSQSTIEADSSSVIDLKKKQRVAAVGISPKVNNKKIKKTTD